MDTAKPCAARVYKFVSVCPCNSVFFLVHVRVQISQISNFYSDTWTHDVGFLVLSRFDRVRVSFFYSDITRTRASSTQTRMKNPPFRRVGEEVENQNGLAATFGMSGIRIPTQGFLSPLVPNLLSSKCFRCCFNAMKNLGMSFIDFGDFSISSPHSLYAS